MLSGAVMKRPLLLDEIDSAACCDNKRQRPNNDPKREDRKRVLFAIISRLFDGFRGEPGIYFLVELFS